jgi:NADH-ubiquinone oxidoreductase chain 5
MYKLVDKGILEIFGPYGITYNLYNWSIKINKLQTGYIYHYIGYIFLILLLLLFTIVYMFY